ncbi:MAG: hypothetical protein OEZ36_09195 [Spirochaetota bacterium]|nr:hypothetical protein [Spirochaetota bacterium]
MKLISILLTILFCLFANDNINSKSPKKINLKLNTKKGEIKINGKRLKSLNIKDIHDLLGPHDRLEIHKTKGRYEEWGGEEKTSDIVDVQSYYYLYDKLGLLFQSGYNQFPFKKPIKFYVYFANKREFDHDLNPPAFQPKKPFRGSLSINNIAIKPNDPIISSSIHYRTKSIKLYNTRFSPRSIATQIFAIHASDKKMAITLYLNNPKEKKLSYISIDLIPFSY